MFFCPKCNRTRDSEIVTSTFQTIKKIPILVRARKCKSCGTLWETEERRIHHMQSKARYNWSRKREKLRMRLETMQKHIEEIIAEIKEA